MNISETLRQGHSKALTNQIVEYVGTHPSRLQELMDCFLSNEMRISQRASWAIGWIGEQKPELFAPYHLHLLAALRQEQPHKAIRRNTMRIYQFIDIPDDIESELYDLGISFIMDIQEATAVKAFSLRVCERIVERYPELAHEVIVVIDEFYNFWSSGLQNRARKFLKKWRNLK